MCDLYAFFFFFFQDIKTAGDRTQHPQGLCACEEWQCHPSLSSEHTQGPGPSWTMSCRAQINNFPNQFTGSQGWPNSHLLALQGYSPALSGCHARHWWQLGPLHVKSISQMHTLEEEKEERKTVCMDTMKFHLAKYPILRTNQWYNKKNVSWSFSRVQTSEAWGPLKAMLFAEFPHCL